MDVTLLATLIGAGIGVGVTAIGFVWSRARRDGEIGVEIDRMRSDIRELKKKVEKE